MSDNFYVSDFIRKLMDDVYAVSPEAKNIFLVNGKGERISLAIELGSALGEYEYWHSFSPDPYIGVVLRAKTAILTARSHSLIIKIKEDSGYNRGQAHALQEPKIMVLLSNIFSTFPRAVNALKDRQKNRLPFLIENEYDVQDLVYAMLLPHIKDIRREEAAPSFAGRAARIDFLLKDEKIVLETKMPRPGLGPKEIRSQLIEDMVSYRSNNYKLFIAFVYDPLRKIENPDGVKNDLEREMSTDLYKVKVNIVS
jgi:hypothetical protein